MKVKLFILFLLVLLVSFNFGQVKIKFSPIRAGVGQPVKFSLMNSDSTITYKWNFNDGSPVETGDHVTHTFYKPSNFLVNVSWVDGDGNDKGVSAYVQISESRIVEQVGKAGFAGIPVKFKANRFTTDKLKWDFGDGKSTLGALGSKSVTHVYQNPGSYVLKVSGYRSKITAPVEIRVVIQQDKRALIADSRVSYINKAVALEAKSFGSTVLWDFGDGTVKSGASMIKHTYKSAGNYTVKVKEFGGQDKKEFTLQINIKDDPRSVSIPARILAGEIQDLGLSQALGKRFKWVFSDGTQSLGSAINNKTFRRPGQYTLTIEDPSGELPPLSKNIVVVADTRILKSTAQNVLIGEVVSFSTRGFLGPQVQWNFGDGKQNVLAGFNAKYSYNKVGNYKVKAVDMSGKSIKTFTQQIIVRETTVNFQIRALEFSFSTGKYYAVIPRNSQVPKLALKLLTKGRGLLKGKWVFDQKDLGLFDIMVLSSNVTELKGKDLPRLSSRDLGIHKISLQFLNYTFKEQVPVLKYFVAEKGAIKIINPKYNSKIKLQDEVKLEWKTDDRERLYEIAVTSVPFQYLKDNQLKWQDTKGKNFYMLDLGSYKKDSWIYWLVREKNKSGRILTTSEVFLFKLGDRN